MNYSDRFLQRYWEGLRRNKKNNSVIQFIRFLSARIIYLFILQDGTASCVPHSKIINRLRQCLEGLLVDGSFLPANKFSPKIFITICFYSPFIAFDEDRVSI